MPVFKSFSLKLTTAWQRMTRREQDLIVDMHGFYERQFNTMRKLKPAPGLTRRQQNAGLATGIHERIDEQMQRLRDADPAAAARVQCRRGCSHCCHTNVDITQPEAALLLQVLAQTGMVIDTARLHRQAAVKHAGGWRELAPADQACVFLDDAGECRVYEHRPVVCRKYLVLSDPDLCDMQKHPGGDVLNFCSMEAEVTFSAALTVFAKGSLPGMLARGLPADKPQTRAQ